MSTPPTTPGRDVFIGATVPRHLALKLKMMAASTHRTQADVLRLLLDRATISHLSDIQVRGGPGDAPRTHAQELRDGERPHPEEA